MTVGLCFPGNNFSSDFVYEWSQLLGYCFYKRIGVILAPAAGCNVHEIRARQHYELEGNGTPYDYVFTVDSDQLNIVNAFQELLMAMEKYSNIDILGGWTYMQPDGDSLSLPNAGYFELDQSGRVIVENGVYKYNTIPESIIREKKEPFEVGWIGFACVMYRRGVVKTLGSDAFSAVYQGNWVSDDTGFCLRSREKGLSIYLHPEAYVKHMKIREVKGGD
jgi:GT2 family glycosyltransferase